MPIRFALRDLASHGKRAQNVPPHSVSGGTSFRFLSLAGRSGQGRVFDMTRPTNINGGWSESRNTWPRHHPSPSSGTAPIEALCPPHHQQAGYADENHGRRFRHGLQRYVVHVKRELVLAETKSQFG